MTENWVTFPCTIAEQNAMIMMNMGLAEIMDSEVPDTLIMVSLPYKNPDESGFPDPAELDPLYRLEDEFEKQVKYQKGFYAGRISISGMRILFCYLPSDDQDFRKRFQKAAEQESYEADFTAKEDSEHLGYWDELYPTESDIQVIKDMNVIQKVKEHGDSGTKERPIEHWTFFPGKEAAKPFIEWAIDEGYGFKEEDSGIDEEGRYTARLTHIGTLGLVDVTNHTLALFRKAKETSGKYDGWETPVLKDD